MFKEAFQDLNRLRQIAAAAVRHGFGAYLGRTRLKEVLGPEAGQAEGELPKADRAHARQFRLMLGELGPTFTKLGQLLSTRPDLLPAHWIEELEALQDDCPPLPVILATSASRRSATVCARLATHSPGRPATRSQSDNSSKVTRGSASSTSLAARASMRANSSAKPSSRRVSNASGSCGHAGPCGNSACSWLR
jgi:hypothetical protein